MIADRIGLVLLAPRQVVRQTAAGQGGIDVAWLIAARVLAGETPRLARAVVRGWEGNLPAAWSGLMGALSVVLPDVLGILIAAILLSFFVGRKKPDRTLDVAAYAWIPYLTVTLLGALLFTALGRPMRSWEEYSVYGVALGWAALVWVLGLVELRRQ